MNVVTRAVGLAAIRERRGLAQLYLAERLGLGEVQVTDLESGIIVSAISPVWAMASLGQTLPPQSRVGCS
jgi:transcriptional regulator with XRE-family HTH domain